MSSFGYEHSPPPCRVPLVYKQAKPKQISHAYRSVYGLRVMAYRYSFYLNGGNLEVG